MEFQTEAQEACYTRIAPLMKEIFGDFLTVAEEAPMFRVIFGTAVATTIVYPWGDDDATITTRSYVVTGIELAPDLLEYLLRQNPGMRYGAFGVDPDGDITFEHSIVGSTCTREDLRASTMAVIRTADRLDDEIVSRWGGQRAIDR